LRTASRLLRATAKRAKVRRERAAAASRIRATAAQRAHGMLGAASGPRGCASAAPEETEMKRFKHIVTATDLAAPSLSAVAYAGHLAKGEGAKLTVVHVPHATSLAYTDFVPPIDMLNIDAAIEAGAREELERWCAKNLRKMPVDVVVRSGVTHEVICDVARETGASVIVMATHGRKGFGHMVLGSVTERVLRDAPCPVLVVRPPAAAGARSLTRAPARKPLRKRAA
jgi:universal stress protein A